MNIYILVDDISSWINPFANVLAENIRGKGHQTYIVSEQDSIQQCDIAFYLGCVSIVREEVMEKSDSKVVVHPSALPQGRGFSPLAWQILEGKDIITVTLFEASHKVDEGDIYFTENIYLNGTELNDEIKDKQGNIIVRMCINYIEQYGTRKSYKQTGSVSYYKRRTANDSRLDPYKTIADQFDLLRVVDNKRYPAFFSFRECDYIMQIYKK
jgi:methionyl-tRNA formyltransferase